MRCEGNDLPVSSTVGWPTPCQDDSTLLRQLGVRISEAYDVLSVAYLHAHRVGPTLPLHVLRFALQRFVIRRDGRLADKRHWRHLIPPRRPKSPAGYWLHHLIQVHPSPSRSIQIPDSKFEKGEWWVLILGSG